MASRKEIYDIMLEFANALDQVVEVKYWHTIVDVYTDKMLQFIYLEEQAKYGKDEDDYFESKIAEERENQG